MSKSIDGSEQSSDSTKNSDVYVMLSIILGGTLVIAICMALVGA